RDFVPPRRPAREGAPLDRQPAAGLAGGTRPRTRVIHRATERAKASSRTFATGRYDQTKTLCRLRLPFGGAGVLQTRKEQSLGDQQDVLRVMCALRSD